MGKLFVIEGLDGSGKETQSKRLYKRLREDGYSVMQISYPRYEKESSALVKMYLRGEFGKKAEDINAYISSTFYAADRYASYKTEIEPFYLDGGIVIADRYTTSNMLHQGGKIEDRADRKKYLDWLWDFEFILYNIPVPDEVYFLHIPLEISLERIMDRPNKITQNHEKDIHEEDISHLKMAYNNAEYLINQYKWNRVCCIDEKQIKSVEEIHEEIYLDIINKIKED